MKDNHKFSEREEGMDVYLAPPIPDAEYIVEFNHYYTSVMFKERSPKVSLVFNIVEGEYAGYQLTRHYSVKRLIGETGRNGHFQATSKTCALMMEYCRCFPDQKIERYDRLPMSRWKEGRFRVRTKTPLKNHKGVLVPNQLRSSVIEEIKGKIEHPPP